MATAIIAACLPTLKPLVTKMFPDYFSDTEVPEMPSPVPQRRLPNYDSLFSDASKGTSDRASQVEDGRKYFDLKDGRIVGPDTRVSRLSLGSMFEMKGCDRDSRVREV